MNRVAVFEDAFAGAEADGYILVADDAAGLDRGDRIRVDIDALVHPQRNPRAHVLEPDVLDLADLHTVELNLVTGLQA